MNNNIAKPAPNAPNGVLRNETIAVPLEYLSNFWRSLEMSLINCKVELKPNWTKYCIFSAGGSENHVNDNDNANNIIFTITDTNLYVPLSTGDNEKSTKLLSKVFERSVDWNEYKTKSENKNKTSEHRYFLESKYKIQI